MRKTILATLAVLTLAGCNTDPYDTWAMRPAGYTDRVQFFRENGTDCIYYQVKGSIELKALRRPDGSHMGCKSKAAS